MSSFRTEHTRRYYVISDTDGPVTGLDLRVRTVEDGLEGQADALGKTVAVASVYRASTATRQSSRQARRIALSTRRDATVEPSCRAFMRASAVRRHQAARRLSVLMRRCNDIVCSYTRRSAVCAFVEEAQRPISWMMESASKRNSWGVRTHWCTSVASRRRTCTSAQTCCEDGSSGSPMTSPEKFVGIDQRSPSITSSMQRCD